MTSVSCYRQKPTQRRVAREGFFYIGLSATVAIACFVWAGWLVGLLLAGLTLYIISFFRNPTRRIPQGDGLVISPADGRILEVVEEDEPRYLKGRVIRISIFMSPFNCHINRSPVAGKVKQCFYKPGSYRAAFRPKAIDTNEHNAVLLEDAKGRDWLVVQIAGWLARRIISYVDGGERLKQGERFGLIQFGSRVDLFCPLTTKVAVKPGEKVKAGKTVLATEG